MTVFLAIFMFALGAIVGSFLNVVALRFGTGRSVGGRSGCPSCAKTLSWKELIPIWSFFSLRGRCASCKNPISLQYPLVELVTALVFLGVFLKVVVFGAPLSVPFCILYSAFYIIAFCLLIIISVYDFHHKIIPNEFVYPFIFLALLKPLATFGADILQFPFALEILSGPILFAFFFLLWIISSGRWMGLGDAKLALGIGWLLGFSDGISAAMLSFWLGAIVSIILLGMKYLSRKEGGLFENLKGFTMKSEIPFGPFLAVGALITFLFNFNLLNLPL